MGTWTQYCDQQEDRKAAPCPQELSERRCRFPEIRPGEVPPDLTLQAACRMVQQIKGWEGDSAPGDKFQDLHNFSKGSAVKNLPPRQEIQVWSLSPEEPLQEGTATHSSILAGESDDRGAWQATVQGVAKSLTWLKWMSTPTAFLHLPNPELCLLFFSPKDGWVLISVGGCGRDWEGESLTLAANSCPPPTHSSSAHSLTVWTGELRATRPREHETWGAHPGLRDLQDQYSVPILAVSAPSDVFPLPGNGFRWPLDSTGTPREEMPPPGMPSK